MASSPGTVITQCCSHCLHSSPATELYDPKTFFTHAALLRQAFAHCGRFPTAASRRSLGRVSVPMWPFILSDRLLIVALVGRCPTNQLIRRRPIAKRSLTSRGHLCWNFHAELPEHSVLAVLSNCCPHLCGRLSTRYSPVCHSTFKSKLLIVSFDLHVLSTPPAFVLSQDQTLHKIGRADWLFFVSFQMKCSFEGIADCYVVHNQSMYFG